MKDAVRLRVVRWAEGGDAAEGPDEVAAEEPLEIRVGGRPLSITMRTPGNDQELVAGFLLTEGLLADGALPLLRRVSANRMNAALDGVSPEAIARAARHAYTASSCGLCGKTTVDSVLQRFPRVNGALPVARETVLALPARLDAGQTAFARTGGLHAAAVFDESGALLALREDVGRHNAVDKVIGYALLRRRLPLHRHILMVSGRASFEIVQKALGAGIPVVAAVSAPSSLAVRFADESGQTLIGFLRRGRFNVYAHPERIRW